MAEHNLASASVIAELQVLHILQERLERYVRDQLPQMLTISNPKYQEYATRRLQQLGPHGWTAPHKLRELIERLEVRAQHEQPTQLGHLVHADELQELIPLVRAAWAVWRSREALALLRKLAQLAVHGGHSPLLTRAERFVPDYDTDFYEWCMSTADLIRAGQWDDIDPEALAEEIESLGRSEKRELESRLEVLLIHLLKWQYQPEKRQEGHSWEDTILEQRSQLARLLRDNPSLQPQIPALLAEVYPDAHRRALAQMGYSEHRQHVGPMAELGLPAPDIPPVSLWTAAQVLDRNFWPSP